MIALRYLLLSAIVATFPAAAAPASADSTSTVATAPRIEAEMLDGSRFSLAATTDSPSVLLIWSPDNLASRKSLGEFARFTGSEAARQIRIAGLVVAATDGGQLRRFIKERQIVFPVGTLNHFSLDAVAESPLPLLLGFDRAGKLRAMHRGIFRLRDVEAVAAQTTSH